MRFLFDQSTDRRLASFLQGLGHDVTIVAVDYPQALPDREVLAVAVHDAESSSQKTVTLASLCSNMDKRTPA